MPEQALGPQLYLVKAGWIWSSILFDQTHSLHCAKSLCHSLAFITLWLPWKATSLGLNPLLRTPLGAAPSLGLCSAVGMLVKYATESCLG